MADEREQFLSDLKEWLGPSSAGVPPALAGAGMVGEGEALRRWVAERQRRRNMELVQQLLERQANLQNPSPWLGEAEIRGRYSGYEGPGTGAGDETIFTPQGWGVLRGFAPNPEQTRDRVFIPPGLRREYEQI
jgi:hypothetical protein